MNKAFFHIKKTGITLLLVLFVCISANTFADEKPSYKDSTDIELRPDNPIVAMLDSLVNQKFYKEKISDPEKYYASVATIPIFTDSIYKLRLESMDLKSPFAFVFNQDVKKYIELYSQRRHRTMGKMMGLAKLYYPLFEEQLSKYNLPLELKHLAIVESALNPVARSRAGATGLWQFMYTTAKMYDVTLTSYVDDRRDPLKSTIVACEYLSDLYEIYKDWSLALAAYNCGPGNVNKAIRRSGGKRNFWEIKNKLPRETRGYVPAFIAVNYVMNYTKEHNIIIENAQFANYEIDTVVVKKQLHFIQLSEMLKIPMEQIEMLNPAYMKGVIPASAEKTFVLTLPKKYIADFINNELAIYEYKTDKQQKLEEIFKGQALARKNLSQRTHIVRRGESLGVISRKYRCYTSQLKQWNKLRGNTIHPGQRLIVYAPANGKSQSKTNTTTAQKTKTSSSKYSYNPSAKYIYHTVRKGDTLWDIANKYKGVSVDQIKRLNNISNSKKLRLGQKLRVKVKG